MNKNCCVCSEHFENIMFLNDLHNRLQPTAVPTLVNVRNPPKMLTVQRPPPKRRIIDTTNDGNKKVKLNTTVSQGILNHVTS
jgi:hypothetical protein